MKPELIVVHHSLTKDSGTVSWLAIRKYHVETLGWKDIGYHAGVELVVLNDMSSYEVLMGRPWNAAGAHEPKVNSRSLGICFVGNFDEEEPSEKILITGAKVIKLWMELFGISKDNIYRHSDFRPDKSCPGKKFDMRKLLSFL